MNREPGVERSLSGTSHGQAREYNLKKHVDI
jgi:hypothetical protein